MRGYPEIARAKTAGFIHCDLDEIALVQYLHSRRLLVSLRSATGTGGIRICMYDYNTMDYIDALITEKALAKASAFFA